MVSTAQRLKKQTRQKYRKVKKIGSWKLLV